jgi:hypothetical protein
MMRVEGDLAYTEGSYMSKLLTMRTAAGLAVLSMGAIAPAVAGAADSDATGTLTGGSLTVTAPAFTSFSTTLTGVSQQITTAVGAWSVTDARGTNAGYRVTVAASVPEVDGVAAAAGTGSSLTLTPTDAVAAEGNPAADGPVASSAQLLSTTAATIQTAIATTGQGQWNFAADVDEEENLAVVIPGDASAGDYSSTLTYTTAAPAA